MIVRPSACKQDEVELIENNPTSIGDDQGLDYLVVGGGSSSIPTETI